MESVLFTAIKHYREAIIFYSQNHQLFNLNNIYLDIPSDWIDSTGNNLELIKSNNSNSISFNLLISGVKIDYNSEIKNNLKIKSNQEIKNNLNKNYNVRKYSTLIIKPYNQIIRKFSTSNRNLNNNFI